MKSLVMSISLSLSVLCVCICTYMGVRIIPTVIRTLTVFGISFAGTILLALVIFIPYFSNQKPVAKHPALPNPANKQKVSTE